MSFARSETQSMLADMASRLLTNENEFEDRRRRLMGETPDRLKLLPILAKQGILGAAFTEEAGGFGGSMRDLAVIMEIVGERLVVEPVLAAAICGRILFDAGRAEEVTPVIEGRHILAFAHMEGFDPFTLPACTARPKGDAFVLDGRKIAVRHADLAHAFIVTAALDGAIACFLMQADAPGLQRDTFRLIDASSAASLEFAEAPAILLGGAATVQNALIWMIAGLAAEIVGIMAALNAAAFSYLATRKQFGVALSSFQALRHRAADMFAAAEEARVLTSRLVDAIDRANPGRFALASAVKALTDDLGRKVAHEAVQLHGGMGVSDELNVSHYLRRMAAIRGEFGGADIHRDRFAMLSRSLRNGA